MANINPLADALCDVRRAYRLLAAYQQRILEYKRSIALHLDFEFYYTVPKFRFPTNALNFPLELSAWSFLPLSRLDSLWLKHQGADQYRNGEYWDFPLIGDMMLVISHEPDSGLVDGLNAHEDLDPMAFNLPQECSSKLGLWLFVNRVNRIQQANWRDTIYSPADRPPDHQIAQPPAYPDVDSYFEEIDLVDLSDEEDLVKAVDEFAQRAGNELGVQLP